MLFSSCATEDSRARVSCTWVWKPEKLEEPEPELDEELLPFLLAEDSDTAERILEASKFAEELPEREPEDASHQLEDSRRRTRDDSELSEEREWEDSLRMDCNLEIRLRSAVLREELPEDAEMADWMAEIKEALLSERRLDSERVDSDRD